MQCAVQPAARLRQRGPCPALPAARRLQATPQPRSAGSTRVAAAPARSGQRGVLRVRAQAAADPGEPFQPERVFHKGVVETPQEPPQLLGFTFGDFYYFINIAYWSAMLLSVLTGNELLSWLVHFEHYTTAMFASSVLFTLWHVVKFARDVRQHLQSEARRDWRQMLQHAWNAIFWAGFVLWYLAPPVTSIADYTGTPGAVMCLYGAALAVAAALQVGHFSFMGSPQVPRKLHTRGIYGLLRHPQALGNMLFLIGFSLAGGAVWASLTFLAAFAFYVATVVPQEELMLREAFGDQYGDYAKRTPRFAYALALLLVLECVLLWRFQPWAVPINATPPAAA